MLIINHVVKSNCPSLPTREQGYKTPALSLRAQRGNPESLQMLPGLPRCARNDGAVFFNL